MRILQIISARTVNGAAVHCLDLSRALSARGHRVVLLSREASWIGERFAAEGGEAVSSSLDRFPLSELRRIGRILREERIDVIQTHMSRAHLFGILLRRLTGVPVVATAHARHVQPHWVFNDAVIAPSAAAAVFHRRWNLVPERKLTVIPSFVDLERFRPRASGEVDPDRRALGLPTEGSLVGFVGSIFREKGLEELVAAMPRVLEAVPDAKFLFVGAGPAHFIRRLAEKARWLGVEGALHFLGPRNDVAKILPHLDLFVFPSWSETVGLAPLEAMACGVPVVATRAGGLPEVVEDGVTGRLVPVRNPLLLAEAIVSVISSPGRRAMGEAGRRRVETGFSREAAVAKTEALLERLVHVMM